MINQQELKKSKIVQLTQLNLFEQQLNVSNKMSTHYAEFLGNVMDNNYGVPSTWFENIVSNDTLLEPYMQNQKISQNENKNKSNQVNNQQNERHNPANLRNPNLFKIDFLLITFQIVLAYIISLAFFGLTLFHQFPYFQIVIIICFLFLLCPRLKNISIMDCFMLLCIPCSIANNYIGVRVLTYLEILIFYFSISLCKRNKKYIKLGFIAIVFFIFGILAYLILPYLYYVCRLGDATIAYYYLFPIFLYLANLTYNFLYLYIGYPSPILYQTSFFIVGLEYGTILTLSSSQIQFWYLLIITNLLLIEQRLLLSIRLFLYLSQIKHRQMLLLRVNSGYQCMNSFHLIILIYLFCYVPFYSAPYASQFNLGSYSSAEPYKPALAWIMRSIYQLISFIIAHKKRRLIICGHLFYTPLAIGFRIVCLIFGIWLFYLGLGAGKYITISIK